MLRLSSKCAFLKEELSPTHQCEIVSSTLKDEFPPPYLTQKDFVVHGGRITKKYWSDSLVLLEVVVDWKLCYVDGA